MRLDRAKFQGWLKTKPADAVVGRQRSPSCPLAGFYREASRGCEIVIFDRGGQHFIDRGYSTRPLPYWADVFVVAVDGEEAPKITASRALEILAQIAT